MFLAVTATQLEASGVDVPLCVARVGIENWKKI
jgi:hypothetical protein